MGKDAKPELKLLLYDIPDPLLIIIEDDRALLGAEDMPLPYGMLQRLIQSGNRLHQPHMPLLLLQSPVNLQEWDDMLFLPEIIRCVFPVDLSIHRILEKDRRQNPIRGKCGIFDDPRPHLMDQIKHLLIPMVLCLIDSIGLQRLRGRASALIESGDKAPALLHPLELFRIHTITSSFRRSSGAAELSAPFSYLKLTLFNYIPLLSLRQYRLLLPKSRLSFRGSEFSRDSFPSLLLRIPGTGTKKSRRKARAFRKGSGFPRKTARGNRIRQ